MCIRGIAVVVVVVVVVVVRNVGALVLITVYMEWKTNMFDGWFFF